MNFLSVTFLLLVSTSALMAAPVVKNSTDQFVIKGLMAATFTAMNPDMTINLAAIPAQAAQLAADGVMNVFVCGTTGESLKLSLSERKQIAEAWAPECKKNGLTFVVHVGAESVMDGRELSEHANQIGADAIAAMPSVFFKAADTTALVATMKYLADGAPSTPFYYYHIPSMTGVMVDSGIQDFLALAAKEIPSFNGIKFTDYNLYFMSQLVEFRDDSGRQYQIMFGRDEEMVAAALLGIDAFVGSTYNYAGKLYNRVLDALHSGNDTQAVELQHDSQHFITAFKKYSGNANKAIMALCKVDVGPARLPTLPTPQSEIDALKDDLTKMGFFEWVK